MFKDWMFRIGVDAMESECSCSSACHLEHGIPLDDAGRIGVFLVKDDDS